MTPPSQHLKLGYVSRAHGLHGELGIRTFDPGSETLFEVERVLLRLRSGEERTLGLVDCRSTNKELLVKLDTIRHRASAEHLVGATVFVFREDLEAPGEGEYFLGDLVGLEAVDPEGRVLGKVEDIWDVGPVPNLVILGAGGEELMVPFADEFVPEVSLEHGRIVVRPPVLLE